MSTLVSDSKSQRAYVPTTALAKSVEFDDQMMHVSLTDGRLISVPIIWFPLLRDATSDSEKIRNWRGRNVAALARTR